MILAEVMMDHTAKVSSLSPNQAFKPTGHKKPWPAA
jgi:hypothetical protein